MDLKVAMSGGSPAHNAAALTLSFQVKSGVIVRLNRSTVRVMG